MKGATGTMSSVRYVRATLHWLALAYHFALLFICPRQLLVIHPHVK